jgi:prepilin-type N-terminal cleavage/methylation domain-containing protein
MKQLASQFKAFSLIELMIGIAILSFVGVVGMASFNALSNKKSLQYESEIVKQDMYVMQSRAVTGLRDQRFRIMSNSSYQLEEDLLGTGNWTVYQSARSFKPGIYFYGYSGKETKLEYKPNGLPDFNGAASDPFFSLIYQTTAEQKEFHIDSSGVVNIVTN